LLVMGESLNKNAQSFRSLPREEAINRLKADYKQMMEIFDKLTAEEWGNFIVTHPYMGGLPTFFYPAFHVMDYGVHTWDMRWGLGEKDRKLDETTAGVWFPICCLRSCLPQWINRQPRGWMWNMASKFQGNGEANGAQQ